MPTNDYPELELATAALWAKAAMNGHVYDDGDSIDFVAKVVLDAVTPAIEARAVENERTALIAEFDRLHRQADDPWDWTDASGVVLDRKIGGVR